MIYPNAIPSEYYTVQRGDTLYSIANRYNMTVDELKRLNNLTSNTLSVGQQLIVLSNGIDTPETEQPDIDIPEILPPEETIDSLYYTVVPGDSLWSIAKKFNLSIDDIINANNLSTINLQIGDTLFIPITDTILYEVKSGDTLWSIAKQFNTTVDTITSLNNLTSNLLKLNQQLLIPS